MQTQHFRGYLAVCLLMLVCAASAWAETSPLPRANVQGVSAVGITVSDMDRALDFYTQVLSFRPVSETEVSGEAYEHLMGVFGLRMRVVRLALGTEAIELVHFLAPQGRPMPVDSRGNDRWFQHIAIIVSDMDRAYQRLREHNVQHASPGPQRLPDWNPNAGGIEAFYFRDPDGNFLEVLQFPPGKGDSKWHQSGERLFLGVDHTAIVVSNTEASLRFYRDALGLAVVGESENYGPEQERLNNVFGARLLITTLRGAVGPGIELLEYIAPRTGRPMPRDTHANDLWHWHTVLLTEDLATTAQGLRSGHYAFVSPSVIALPAGALDFEHGLMVRGPDGHAMLLAQRRKEYRAQQ
jgi:catechol 2,3-dioxygenase-like lactoylglutathione lyase family enzyme